MISVYVQNENCTYKARAIYRNNYTWREPVYQAVCQSVNPCVPRKAYTLSILSFKITCRIDHYVIYIDYKQELKYQTAIKFVNVRGRDKTKI